VGYYTLSRYDKTSGATGLLLLVSAFSVCFHDAIRYFPGILRDFAEPDNNGLIPDHLPTEFTGTGGNCL